jgi:8-oxo-dGTP pyrophosphatase MutT (NUDIX family)
MLEAASHGAATIRSATRGDADLGPGRTPSPPTRLRAASVLVPLIERENGLTVLLTQRTPHLSMHAGQVAFPGGGQEPEDADAIATALRETEEEIGLSPERVRIIGRLDTYVTGSNYRVTPIVGLLRQPFTLLPDPVEVAAIFEVPLAFVVDPANHERRQREFNGTVRHFYVLPHQERYIWGATAGMLVNLAELLAPQPVG